LGVTIRDVAKKAGVSVATASRVLGNYGYVSAETSEIVMSAAHQLGYRPHSLAKSLVTGRTNMVGFVVGDIENPFFASLAKWINASISIEGYTMLVYTTDENVDEEAKGVYSLIEKNVDGIIIAPASIKEYKHILDARDSGIPVVVVDRPNPHLEIDTVAVENNQSVYEAIRELIKLGHREIGFYSDSLEIGSNLERLEGYKRALTDAGIEIDPQFIYTTGYSILDGYRGAVSILSSSQRPSAIFTANNFITTGFLLAANDMKLLIPEYISLIGFDDLEWYKLNLPRISVVSQPQKRISQVVSRILINRMGDKNRLARPEIVRLPGKLILRESTAPNVRQEEFTSDKISIAPIADEQTPMGED